MRSSTAQLLEAGADRQSLLVAGAHNKKRARDSQSVKRAAIAQAVQDAIPRPTKLKGFVCASSVGCLASLALLAYFIYLCVINNKQVATYLSSDNIVPCVPPQAAFVNDLGQPYSSTNLSTMTRFNFACTLPTNLNMEFNKTVLAASIPQCNNTNLLRVCPPFYALVNAGAGFITGAIFTGSFGSPLLILPLILFIFYKPSYIRSLGNQEMVNALHAEFPEVVAMAAENNGKTFTAADVYAKLVEVDPSLQRLKKGCISRLFEKCWSTSKKQDEERIVEVFDGISNSSL